MGVNPRDAILEKALQIAPFEGWTDTMLAQATDEAGLPEGADELYFPEGVLGLLDYWHRQTRDRLEAEIAARGLANLRVRDRVREGVLTLFELTEPYASAMRRALSRLALPDAGGRAARQTWEMADSIWAGIGDTSTDFNFYTKRAILSGVIASSLVAWLNDTSEDKAEARAFLDRRLADVMRFETVKARARKVRGAIPNPAEALGSLRYRVGYGLGSSDGLPGRFARVSTKRRRRRSR